MTAIHLEVSEGVIAFVEKLPGVNTRGDTLEEARENLEEAIQMVLEANREMSKPTLAGETAIRKPFCVSA